MSPVIYTILAIDKASKALNKISRSSDDLDKKMKGLSSTARGSGIIGNMFSGLSNKIAGLAGAYAGLNVVSSVIQKGMEFEDSIAEIEIITGATGKSLQFYSDKSLELAQKWGISASEIAMSIKDVGSAKSELLDTPGALVEITEKAIMLAKASGLAVPDAVKAMTGSLNQFGYGAERAAEFANVLAQSANVGAAEIPEMTEALKMAGGVARLNNVSFEETNAVLQLMAKNNIKGSEAGAGFVGVMAGLKDKLDWDPKKMGFIEAMRQVKKASESGQISLLETFGREREKDAAAILLNIGLYDEFLAQMKVGGEVERQSNVRQNTMSAKMAIIRERVAARLITIFDKLQPTIERLADSFTRWLGSITPEEIENIGSAMSALGTVLLKIAGFVQMLVDGARSFGEFVAKVVTGVDDEEELSGAHKRALERQNPGMIFNTEGDIRRFMESGGPQYRKLQEAKAQKANEKMMLQLGQKVSIDLNDPAGLVNSVESTPLMLRPVGKRNFGLVNR